MDDPKRVKGGFQDFFEILLKNYEEFFQKGQYEAPKLIQKKNFKYLDYLVSSKSYGES